MLLYWIMFFAALVLSLGYQFFSFFRKKKMLGEQLYIIEGADTKKRATVDTIIKLAGFSFIVYYYYTMSYKSMNLTTVVLILICGYAVACQFFFFYLRCQPMGLYENGILTTVGIEFYQRLSKYSIVNDNKRKNYIVIFNTNRRVQRKNEISILHGQKGKVNKILAEKITAKSQSETEAKK